MADTPLKESSWLQANQAFVAASVRLAQARLEATAEHDNREAALAALEDARSRLTAPAALERIRDAFGLSAFEYELLVLCAAAELSTEVGNACARLHNDARKRWPSFGLALAILPDPHWSAFSPELPLRRLRLLQVSAGGLSDALLQIEERVLQEIVGLPCLDERLRGSVTLPVESWVPQHFGEVLSEMTACLTETRAVAMLSGGGSAVRRSLAGAAFRKLGLAPLSLRAADVPTQAVERELLLALVRRELLLRGAGLILEVKNDDAPASVVATLSALAEEPISLIVSSSQALATGEVAGVSIALPTADSLGQRALWREVLQDQAGPVQSVTDELAEEFRLDADEIFGLGREWRARAAAGLEAAVAGEHPLRTQARALNRGRFAGLAQLIVPSARPGDLVLPPAQAETVRQIEQHVRHRRKVLDEWGFGQRDGRGLGITALFHGPSGTGKTLAAEVIAARLGLDLVRVDLSQTVSKYIGDTEKNLARIFDAADRGGVVLLFDEADALFGKRSEVKDSHDRHANIEVGYLLQRVEAFRGLAILTTNLRQAMDAAFLRRLRFVVAFPFPDVEQRAEIWRRVLPREMPRAGVDVERLARLNVTGGNIRNIALHAAYLAADEGAVVGMRHMLRASKGECQRIEKSVSQSEIGGWA